MRVYLLFYKFPKKRYFAHVQAGVYLLGVGGLGDKARLVLCPIKFSPNTKISGKLPVFKITVMLCLNF